MSWFLFSIRPLDSALKAIVISYPTKGTVNHFYCLRIPWPILTATNKPGVVGEVPQLCRAVEDGVWGLPLFSHGSDSIRDKNTLTAFSGLGYLAMGEGSPFDSSQMGQLPPLPAIWKWEVFNQRLINVANMYSVESIILFNLATPPASPPFYE